jgi:uncharacterized membrane protein (Fun14 family)
MATLRNIGASFHVLQETGDGFVLMGFVAGRAIKTAIRRILCIEEKGRVLL